MYSRQARSLGFNPGIPDRSAPDANQPTVMAKPLALRKMKRGIPALDAAVRKLRIGLQIDQLPKRTRGLRARSGHLEQPASPPPREEGDFDNGIPF